MGVFVELASPLSITPDPTVVMFRDDLSAIEQGAIVEALGPAEYELFARGIVRSGGRTVVFESNLIRFKILGTNPGQNKITSFIDSLTEPIRTDAQNATFTIPLKAWYKAILRHESRDEGRLYTSHHTWDQFERVTEAGVDAGNDLGFPRGLSQGETLNC